MAYCSHTDWTPFRPSWKEHIGDFLSWTALDRSFWTLIRHRKEKPPHEFLPDGTTPGSMIITSANLGTRRANLERAIDDNLHAYRTAVLSNFAELNFHIRALYLRLARETAENQLHVHIVLSPYHPRFQATLLADPILRERFTQWKTFMYSLEEAPSVKIFDPTKSAWWNTISDENWRDGLHYDRRIAEKILGEIINTLPPMASHALQHQ